MKKNFKKIQSFYRSCILEEIFKKFFNLYSWENISIEEYVEVSLRINLFY